MLKTINVFSALHAAEAAKRYSRDDALIEENVLLHTGWVVSWCFFCAKSLEQEGIKIDFSSLLQKAVVHDFDEIGTGDIPRITKYADADVARGIKKIEELSVKKLANYIDIESLLPIWQNAKDKTIEGKLVKLADISAVVYKVWYEILRRNNYSFGRVCIELRKIISEVFEEIKMEDNVAFNNFVARIGDDFNLILGKAAEVCAERIQVNIIGFTIGNENDKADA